VVTEDLGSDAAEPWITDAQNCLGQAQYFETGLTASLDSPTNLAPYDWLTKPPPVSTQEAGAVRFSRNKAQARSRSI
jgi:hypothetical protein